MRKICTTISCLALVLCALGPASAALISVSDPADVVASDGRCTLREALDNANLPAGGDTTGGDCAAGSAGHDTIELPPAVYAISLAAPPNEDANAAGDFDVLDHLTLAGAGVNVTTIDADGVDRVLDVGPGGLHVEVEIVEFSLVGGFLAGPSQGGGVRVGAAAVTNLSGSSVRGNIAESGGGIYNEGTLFVGSSELRGNSADFGGDGGGLFNRGDAEVIGSSVSANSADGNGAGIHNAAGITIQDTLFDFDSAGGHGGAIHNTGTAQVVDSSFGVCESGLDGGAIYHAGPSMLIQTATFLNNTAFGNGGAIYSAGTLVVQRADILGNIALRDGGAIVHTFGTAAVTDSNLQQNLAGEIGGGIHNSATLQVINSSLQTNQGTVRGGGLYNTGSALLSLVTVFTNFTNGEGGGFYNTGFTAINGTVLNGNIARHGAGAYVAAGGLSNVVNSTFSGNDSQEEGGGLFVEGTAQIDFSTITLNQSAGTPAGGIFNIGDVRLKNSILSQNGDDCVGGVTSFGYNIDSDFTCGLFGVADLSGVNPNLGPLQFNGGLTKTHALLLPSNAIDSADPDCLTQFSTVVTEDQRQMPRPVDGDGGGTAECDRGAYESALPSGPQPPVPNGIFGSPLLVDKVGSSTTDLDLEWDVSLCPSTGYHLIYGDLSTVSSYAVGGSQCNLSPTGSDLWLGPPATSVWFLVIADDAVQTEGSWGDASAGVRNGAAPSGQCSILVRDNTGTCP